MTCTFRLGGLSALLLLVATPAPAEESDRVILWDQAIATSMREAHRERPCRDNPYRDDGRACLEPGLNLGFGRERSPRLSALDRFVLFVDESRRVEADRRLDGGARLDFNAELQTLTPDEAEIEVTFKIQF